MRSRKKSKRVKSNTLYISNNKKVHTLNRMSANSNSIEKLAKIAKLINNIEKNEDIRMNNSKRNENKEYVVKKKREYVLIEKKIKNKWEKNAIVELETKKEVEQLNKTIARSLIKKELIVSLIRGSNEKSDSKSERSGLKGKKKRKEKKKEKKNGKRDRKRD